MRHITPAQLDRLAGDDFECFGVTSRSSQRALVQKIRAALRAA